MKAVQQFLFAVLISLTLAFSGAAQVPGWPVQKEPEKPKERPKDEPKKDDKKDEKKDDGKKKPF